MNQSVANIFFGTEYEYEYIRNLHFGPNTNMNIFGILQLTEYEYEYEYIRFFIVDRIRIFEYSNTNTNIRIFQYIIWPKSTKNWSNLTQVSVFSCVWVSESWPPYTSCIIALTDLCSRFLIFVLYYRWSGDKILINFVFWNIIIRTTVQNHRPPILKIVI